MRFSPVGGGARCLLLAEEADRVIVVDARTFETAQTHEFYGGIVGVDFEGDGEAFWAANCDGRFGGFMRWKRRGQGQESGLGFLRKGLESDGEEDWVKEEDRVRDARCMDPMRSGRRWHL
jgi:hypothetical protein